MADNPYLQWPVFRRSVVAAFQRSLTVDRVSEWLRDAMRQCDDRTILVIGHRATFYALEHLLNRVTLHEAMSSPWTWQPGWIYYPGSSPDPRVP